MISYQIILLLLPLIQSQLRAGIFYSNYTNIRLLEAVSNNLEQAFSNKINLKKFWVTSCSDFLSLGEETQIIVDLTFSVYLEECIKDFSVQAQSILVSIENNKQFYSDWQFFTHIATRSHIDALLTLSDYLNWDKFVLISDEIQTQFMSKFRNKNILFHNIAETVSQITSDNFIAKEIKITGVRNIIILNTGEAAKKLVQSLVGKNLFIVGSGIILGSKSIWGTVEDGALAFIEDGLESAFDSNSYEALSCVKFVNLILKFGEISDMQQLKQFLENSTINHFQIPKFSLVNIQNKQLVKVGEITKTSLRLDLPILFPGNSSSIPNTIISNIRISMADGSTNPGYPDSPFSYVIKWGATYAFSYIKENHFLDGFEFQVTHTDCGAEVYNKTFSFNCIKKLKNVIGVAMLASYHVYGCVGNIVSLRALNITIPHVSDLTAGSLLMNQTLYPEFMRVYKDTRYNVGVIFSLISTFNYKSIITFYSESTSTTAAYLTFEGLISNSNIKMVNDANERNIIANYQQSDVGKYKEIIKKVMNLKIKIYVLFIAPPSLFNFIKDLYDLGMRRGDAVFLLWNRVSFFLLSETDPVQIMKLNELMFGSIVIDQLDWIGKYGETIREGYTKIYGSAPPLTIYRCLSFDSAMLLANGIKFTLYQGENLENGKLLNANIRKQRFTGCSGTVSIEPGGNDRSFVIYGIFNVRYNQTQQSLYEYLSGKYDMGSVEIITFFEDIIWYDNTTNIPPNFNTYGECPFDSKLIKYSQKGAGILYGISFSVIIIAGIITFFIWKKWWNIDIEKLKTPVLAKLEDYFVMGMIFIYFLQYLALSPDIGEYDKLSSWISSYASLNLGWITEGKHFWNYVKIVLIIVVFWIYLSIIIIFKFEGKFKNFVFDYSKNFAEIIMPIIGNTGFIPIVSVLINVIQCDQAIGNDLTQSFVRKDCSEFCWKSSHLSMAIYSIIALIIYVPLAIYFRPYWDSSSNYINIKTRPLFLMVKSLFQIFIIILNKALKHHSQSLYGLIYIISFLGFLYLCLKKKPYNYDRCNLWTTISYCAIIWSVSLSALYWIVPYRSVAFWMIFQYVGWVLLIAIGSYCQYKYYPSFLRTEKPIDISILFKFSLGREASAEKIKWWNKERSGKMILANDNEEISSDARIISN